jgi:hypothetical protein
MRYGIPSVFHIYSQVENPMKLHFVLAFGLFAGTAATAADSPFVGTWKMNTDKSQVTGLRAEVKDLGGNKYEFKFGNQSQTILADGKQHPDTTGSGTWSLKQNGTNKWTIVNEQGGKVTSTETWTISEDGNTSSTETKGTRPDGSAYTEGMSLKRLSGGPGISGVWESTQANFMATDFVIKAWGNDGLSFVTPAYSEHLDVKFDGKDYPDHGPRVAPESMSSAKRVDDHAIEMTDKLKGKTVDTADFEVSQDGKTLTVTVHVPGEEKALIYVYDKQNLMP